MSPSFSRETWPRVTQSALRNRPRASQVIAQAPLAAFARCAGSILTTASWVMPVGLPASYLMQMELTQCRSSLGVWRSPWKTWPKCDLQVLQWISYAPNSRLIPTWQKSPV